MIEIKQILCAILNFGHHPYETFSVDGLKTKSGVVISMIIESKCECGKYIIDNRKSYEKYKKENDEIENNLPEEEKWKRKVSCNGLLACGADLEKEFDNIYSILNELWKR